MKKFGSDQEPYEFNEIEIIEETGETVINPKTDGDIHKNLDQSQSSPQEKTSAKNSSPLRYFSSIPYDQLSRREKKRVLRMEKRVQRKKFYYEYKAEKHRIKAELKAERRRLRVDKPMKYHWAFFLCFALIGLGLSIMMDGPVALFIGIGIGLLFFVGPIYDKVMTMINEF